MELYVLGMLPPDEGYKIAQLALLFPEIQEELDRIGASLVGVAGGAAAVPAPSVKEGLMERLRNLKREENESDVPVVPIHTGRHLHVAEEQTDPGVVPMQPPHRTGKVQFWLPAAALIGVLLSLGGVIFLANKNRDYRNEVAGLQQNMRSLNRQVVTLQRENLASGQMLQMMQSDVYKKIKLSAVPGKRDALAQLFWNTETKEVFISPVSLPAAPQGKQYQLWAIVDGKPVDGGMLGSAQTSLQQMKTFERAEAFAITLEQAGGSPVPTMEAMWVMGKV
ncbi:anti-sigma factor [Paracnuella aquatica]|uniref:anti-sigma factor n=1 Tax=Paracnuella aquatica TaxID=2268757 RepID=UPI000DF01957|nr:anti-sigma factor [Paracnuella aquatica]RPD46691.1 anti-sigma factor [Paracnuella aquatica]